ncbi:MAG: hypothetical protein R2713_01275 [Ilumatobacteraceae bacterium]
MPSGRQTAVIGATIASEIRLIRNGAVPVGHPTAERRAVQRDAVHQKPVPISRFEAPRSVNVTGRGRVVHADREEQRHGEQHPDPHLTQPQQVEAEGVRPVGDRGAGQRPARQRHHRHQRRDAAHQERHAHPERPDQQGAHHRAGDESGEFDTAERAQAFAHTLVGQAGRNGSCCRQEQAVRESDDRAGEHQHRQGGRGCEHDARHRSSQPGDQQPVGVAPIGEWCEQQLAGRTRPPCRRRRSCRARRHQRRCPAGRSAG